MNPCTRSTLFRLVLAIRLYGCGLSWLGRYVIPRKYKVCIDAATIRLRRLVTREVLNRLRDGFVMHREMVFPLMGCKIGDTIRIPKPTRFQWSIQQDPEKW